MLFQIQPYREPLLKMTLILGVFIVLIGSLEIYFYVAEPTEENKSNLIQNGLEKAKNGFYKEIQLLEKVTHKISAEFEEEPFLAYTFQINRENDIDFIVLDSLKRIINWSDQAPQIPVEKMISRGNIYRISLNERDYLAFTIEKNSYSVTGITLAKNTGITQPGINKTAYSIVSKWTNNIDYPIQLQFLAKDVWNVESKETLYVGDGKIIGYLVGYPNSISLLNYHWNGFKERFRAAYLLGFVLISLGLFWFTSNVWPIYERFLFRISLVTILWILTSYSDSERYIIDLFINWGLYLNRSLSIDLFRLTFHTFFFSLASFEIIRISRIQRRYFGIDWYPRTILFSLATGMLTYISLSSIPSSYYHLINTNEISLLDPNLFPPIEVFLFITGLSISFGFGFLLSVFGNLFILQSERDSSSLFHFTHFLGFVGIHLIFRLTGIGYSSEFDIIGSMGSLYILVISVVQLLLRNPNYFQHYSKLRLLLLGSLFLTVLLYPTIHLRYQTVAESDLNNKTWALINDLNELGSWKNVKSNSSAESQLYAHDRGVWPGNTYIAVYDSTYRLAFSWNRNLIQFSESGRLGLNLDEINTLKKENTLEKTVLKNSKLYLDHYFYVHDSNVFIRGIIPIIPFQSHVFSFFRFFYTILFLLLGLYIIQAVFSNKPLLLLDTKENLQSRILDSYIIASLMFLVALVGTTGYIVLSDDVENHLNSLQEKKELIIDAIAKELNGKLDEPFLRYLAQRFEVSIDLFDPRRWITGASFQNIPVVDSGFLIERSIYESLIMFEQLEEIRWYDYGKEQIGAVFLKVTHADQTKIMQISLRSTVSGTNEALLKTVSYLIAVYVFVFGLFIVLAFFISSYLADPLKRLLQGLRRISSGRLDTIVPVTTQDEIGELANAYNFMIFRLKDLQKELAEAERQAAWTEMARQIAHEIKNPLTPMKLSLQHLQRLVLLQNEEDETLKPTFERISKTLIQQIDSLSSIASDFSKFAQPQTEPFAIQDVNALIEEINELYQHDQFIKINLDLSDNPLFIEGIADDLKRVFINLMKNSIESMPNGGIIIVRSYPYKENAYIEFADTGSGIPIEIQPKIFSPNFSTKTSGTGIGLAICKKVVEAHHGSISFASVPGSGTTFTLHFPIKTQIEIKDQRFQKQE